MRKNKKRALKITAAGLVLVIVLAFIGFQVKLKPLIRLAAANRSQLLAEKIITTAAAQCAEDGFFDYNALINIQYDSDGKPISLNTDTAMLNLLRASLSQKILSLLSDSSYSSASFPLGSVLSGDVFSGIGPQISFRLASDSFLTTELEHKMESAGINQTLHKLSLRVSGTMTVLLPSGQTQIFVNSQIPVAQTVIFGTVPDWYIAS